ncbi:hypothetical protein BDR26DRAFT_532508 [Obelidium mucronatum]|nr:hypothetical protein BDR26DRAFT_532508 [Obelidium mucronatum]
MNQLLISFILLARLAAPAPGFAANSNPDWYCHNFLDTTTASALVYEEISCMLNGAQVWVWNFGSRSQASTKNPNAVAVNPIYYPVYPTGC